MNPFAGFCYNYNIKKRLEGSTLTATILGRTGKNRKDKDQESYRQENISKIKMLLNAGARVSANDIELAKGSEQMGGPEWAYPKEIIELLEKRFKDQQSKEYKEVKESKESKE